MDSSPKKLNFRVPKGRKFPYQVRVYRFRSDVDLPRDFSLVTALDRKDRHRLAKIQFKQDRNNFILSRWLLNEVLRRDWEIERAKLTYTAKGKPKLKSGPAISWSHSKYQIVVAVGDVAALGVDVELMNRPMSTASMGRILLRYSSSIEISRFQAAQLSQKKELFYKLWCEKEAFAKCTGLGIGRQLQFHRKKPYEFYTLSDEGHYIAVCVKPFAHSRVQQYKGHK